MVHEGIVKLSQDREQWIVTTAHLLEEEEECCLFDHHHGSGGYIKTQYKSLTCRPPKCIQFSYVAKK